MSDLGKFLSKNPVKGKLNSEKYTLYVPDLSRLNLSRQLITSIYDFVSQFTLMN